MHLCNSITSFLFACIYLPPASPSFPLAQMFIPSRPPVNKTPKKQRRMRARATSSMTWATHFESKLRSAEKLKNLALFLLHAFLPERGSRARMRTLECSASVRLSARRAAKPRILHDGCVEPSSLAHIPQQNVRCGAAVQKCAAQPRTRGQHNSSSSQYHCSRKRAHRPTHRRQSPVRAEGRCHGPQLYLVEPSCVENSSVANIYSLTAVFIEFASP